MSKRPKIITYISSAIGITYALNSLVDYARVDVRTNDVDEQVILCDSL